MINDITERFVDCVDELISSGTIKSQAMFADYIGISRQAYNEIKQGRRRAKSEMIQKAIEHFYFNPYYIFGGKGERFDNPHEYREVEDNNITMIPIKAQAGYTDHIIDPVFQARLNTFRLPLPKFFEGQFSAFEVEGDSMYPSLDEGDLLICSELDPNYYTHTVKTDKVYVVITKEEVLVKRVTNKFYPQNLLILHSDNESYKDINMRASKIQQIWKVEGVLKHTLEKPERSNSRELESKVSELIKQLSDRK